MSRRLSIRARVWLALTLPPLSWFAFEQGLSALLHLRCNATSLGIAWGLASILLCSLAARIAWPLHQRRGPLASAWLARLALAVAAIFALAILFQTLALSIVPPCVG
ncbi:hypothetical protein [Novosphingobium panipatense]|uniref:Uncharacterized protein n=1 Tax=Novosphingobium panipatense TaxID=428991 RepID=A0ABY1QN52_9SPHN|nr:hypothetical protein [Novosphingobium panipatense]SMP75581.1 hypothetical protein SAMN06296065_10895 [Novosphingobium panipatense]